ncbi:MAG TPA: HAD-IG family 5'-nucleotidase [Candidatus Eisenbacteria bacterium]|nr:HAD-IG family 5'-nucleotidase [Candidatus Eisenbacteria bacterium]
MSETKRDDPAAPTNGSPSAAAPAGAANAAAPREPSARALRSREHRIPRRHRVFVNRNLRMTRIRAIGFDLDHTLAHYDPIPVEELAFDLTKKKLVEFRGYSPEILKFTYDPQFVVRGLVVDKKRGNLLKMDYFNFVSRATHGLTSLRSEERKKAYRTSRVRVGHENYVSVDTLFHLPEVYLYSVLIDFLEKQKPNGGVDYEKVYGDVRAMIDEAHRDGSLKSVITSDLDRYIRFDPELRVVLEEFRRSGKKLFLLTNSEWTYTDKLLQHLLQRGRGAPAHWSELFNVVLVDARKPAFFTETAAPAPIPELKGRKLLAITGSGGGGAYLERALGAAGEHVIYFGDHTYGDILQSKRALGWRTAMLVPELDREIQVTQDYAKDFDRLSKLSSERHHIEIDKAAIGRELRRLTQVLADRDANDAAKREEIAKRIEEIPEQIAEMERRSLELGGEIESVQVKIDRAYNPRWGSLFREGNESSRFGHQLKDFACVYTSRVSNFLHYPWNYYYQSPVGYMPHDI